MSSPRILILGGGLSAAFAWRACRDHDICPDVISDRLFIPPGGFIYVHWLPESVDDVALWEKIRVVPLGKAELYAHKLWYTKEVKTSFPKKEIKTRGVSPLKASRVLWGREEVYQALRVLTLTEDEISALSNEYDAIIRTFPRPTEKASMKTPIWVIPNKDSENVIHYDGTYDNYYVRKAQLFGILSYEFPPIPNRNQDGYLAAEWARNFLSEAKGARLWYAPELPPPELSYDRIEEDYNEKTLYCGRWGTGRRTMLSHETYARTVEFLRLRNLTNG